MAPYRFSVVLALLGVLLPATGCGSREAEKASIQQTLEKKGTIGVMDQVAKSPDYSPPADGRLTERQVTLFLEVRRREQKIREVALGNLRASAGGKEERSAFESLGNVADVATADFRAALELGANPKEYQWIEDRVLEVERLWSAQLLTKSQEAVIQMLENQKKLAKSEEERARLDRQIQEIRESPGEPSTPAKEFNAALLARHKNEFETIKMAESSRVRAPSTEDSQ